MIRGKRFSIVAVGLVLVLCLTMGLFMVFSDANRNSDMNYDIKAVADNSLAMPTSSNRGVSTDLVDGGVMGGSVDYIKKAYGTNKQIVKISTAQELRDWLWYNADQTSAILVNDIVDFNWADQAGWAGGYIAPHLNADNGKFSSINEGVTLDGCGYEVIFNSTNGGDISFQAPNSGSFNNIVSKSYSFFANTVAGTVKNISFDFSVDIRMTIPYNGLNGQEDLVTGLVFADVVRTGVVENVNINQDGKFEVYNNSDSYFWLALHTGILTGRTSGTITQTTVNIGSKSYFDTKAYSGNRYESYAYSGYVAGRALASSLTANITVTTNENSKVWLESGGKDNTNFGMVLGRSNGGTLNGFIYNGKNDIRSNSKGNNISIAVGLVTDDTTDITNVVSAVGELYASGGEAKVAANRPNNYSYMTTDTSVQKGFDIKFDKLSFNTGILHNFILTKKTPFVTGFIWSVEFAKESKIDSYYTYEQYNKQEVSVPMLNANDADGNIADTGDNYLMTLTVGQLGEHASYGWNSSTYDYDGTTHDAVFNAPEGWNLYDVNGELSEGVSFKFETESVTNVQSNVRARLLPVATVYHSGEGIVYLDKANRRMILADNATISNGLVQSTSVIPATITINDKLFSKAFQTKEYDGFNTIDNSLFNKDVVETLKLDIVAADKYVSNGTLQVVNVDYIISGQSNYSCYLSADAGSTAGVIVVNADNNYKYLDKDGKAIDVVDGVMKIYTELPAIAPLQVSVSWDDLGEIAYSGLNYEPQASLNIGTYVNKYVDRPSCTVTYSKSTVAYDSILEVGKYTATASLDNDNYVVKEEDMTNTYTIDEPRINLILSNGTASGSYKDGIMTLIAEAAEGYIFSHWENAYGLLLTEDSTMKVYVSVSDTFKPVFVLDPSDRIIIKFNAENGSLYAKTVGTVGAIVRDLKPADPIKPGFTFIGWYYIDKEIDDSLALQTDEVFTAKYLRNETPIISTITLKDIDGITYSINDEVVKGSKDFGNDTELTISFNKTSSNFLYWTNSDNDILSYDRTYSFYAHDSVSIHPAFDTDIQVISKRISSINAKVINSGSSNANINGSFVIKSGDTLLEHGMLVGSDAELKSSDIVITNTSINKYSLTLCNEYNQFRTLHKADGAGNYKIKAYMILKTATGETEVVYSDVMNVKYSSTQASSSFLTGSSDIEIFGKMS